MVPVNDLYGRDADLRLAGPLGPLPTELGPSRACSPGQLSCPRADVAGFRYGSGALIGQWQRLRQNRSCSAESRTTGPRI
jgi:hypothetical protein